MWILQEDLLNEQEQDTMLGYKCLSVLTVKDCPAFVTICILRDSFIINTQIIRFRPSVSKRLRTKD